MLVRTVDGDLPLYRDRHIVVTSTDLYRVGIPPVLVALCVYLYRLARFDLVGTLGHFHGFIIATVHELALEPALLECHAQIG